MEADEFLISKNIDGATVCGCLG